MRELPKYARSYYDELTNYVSNACRMKRKDLLHKMEKWDFDTFKRSVCKMTVLSRKNNYYQCFRIMDIELATMFFFKDSRRFCVDRIPDAVDFNAFTEYDWDKDIIIDFRYEGVDCFLHAWKNMYTFEFGGVRSQYTVAVYVDSEEMREHNRKALENQYANLWKFNVAYRLHVNADGSKISCEIPDCNFFVKMHANVQTLFTSLGEKARGLFETDTLTEINLPSNETVINVLNHTLYCYENRTNLTRSNGRARKKYECCKVHTPSIESTECEDVYVPLTSYVAQEVQRSEYKGGHHASPVEHERRGFYGKSRGRGDYNLVDGQMVYVGDMQGSYSLVKPTHVNGARRTVVYKA